MDEGRTAAMTWSREADIGRKGRIEEWKKRGVQMAKKRARVVSACVAFVIVVWRLEECDLGSCGKRGRREAELVKWWVVRGLSQARSQPKQPKLCFQPSTITCPVQSPNGGSQYNPF